MAQIDFKKTCVLHISGKSDDSVRSVSMPDAWLQYNLAFLLLGNRICTTFYSFVLMNNHYHLLVSCETQKDLDILMQALQAQEKNTVEIYYERITNFTAFLHSYKYIYLNPVKAGICSKAEEYRYSSLYSILQGKGLTPFKDPFNIIYDQGRVLYWLNGKISNLYYKSHP